MARCYPSDMAAAKSKGSKKKARAKGRAGRKRHVQQSLFRRGGKRRGAGRKSRKARPGRKHERRKDFSARHPLHVVVRVDDAIGTLRCRKMYKAIREATRTAALRQRVRIIHLSIQRRHVHMIVEAADREALARGMQGFQIACARYINRALGRRGRVFVERYYVEIITTPTQALRAIAYVLGNWRHHGEDRDAESRTWLVDPYSTGGLFDGWRERVSDDGKWLRGDEPLVVCAARTWLLAEGWKRVGSISVWGVPGKHGTARNAR